jgi:ABC-type multidrug transport system permease subunit
MDSTMQKRSHPFVQLFLARLREFYREPEAIFWVYGFPLILAIGLGIAFASKKPEPPVVDIVETSISSKSANELLEQLRNNGVEVSLHNEADCRQRFRIGKTALYIEPLSQGFAYHFDPARDESVLARYRVETVVQRLEANIATNDADSSTTQHWKSGTREWTTKEEISTEPGTRYIDFLIPGIMGLNLMGGGLWGIGFVLVDMRVRKLLKRMLATPMRRSHFLGAVLCARMLFILPEMMLLLLLGRLGFGIPMIGSLLTLCVVIIVGALAFSGIGLLVACRANKTETVSGLMNLVMLPMWLLSGTFFSSKRFPEVAQPFIQALPLTQVNDALREVMLEGASLPMIGWRLMILLGYGVVCFLIALRYFKWQ